MTGALLIVAALMILSALVGLLIVGLLWKRKR